MPDNTRPTVWGSIGVTVNTGNYENTKIDIGIAGIPVETTPEELETLLDRSQFTVQKVVESLAAEMAHRLREDFGR